MKRFFYTSYFAKYFWMACALLVVPGFYSSIKAQCPPTINAGHDTSVACGMTANLGGPATTPTVSPMNTGGCNSAASAIVNPAGGAYINNVSTTGGLTTNINNMNTLVQGQDPTIAWIPFANWYSNYTSQIVDVHPGGTFMLNLQGNKGATGSAPPTFSFRIWIDWNNNGVFDNVPGSELVYTTATSGSNPFNFNNIPITVPATAANAIVRMRIRVKYGAPWVPSDAACTQSNPVGWPGQGNYDHTSEIEDYGVKISPSSGGGSGTGYTYSWSPPAGLSATNIPNPTATPSATTVYTLTVTDTVHHCSGVAQVTVTVGQATPTFTNPGPTCSGSSFTLPTLSTNSVSGTWSPAVNNTATTTYTFTPNTGQCAQTTTMTVVVNSPPTVSAAASNSVLCVGQSTTLTGSGAATYTWTGGISNGVAFSPTVTTTYTVTGATAAGCTNTAVATITVNSKPTITVNNPALCSGGTATLTASGANTYTWSGGSTANPYSVSPAATTAYTVTGSSAAGCTNTAVANVTVNPKPTITINNPTICSGATATLTANGANTYTWNGGSTSNPYSVSPAVTTSYTVTGSSAAGCTNTAVANVTVNAVPTVTVNNATICSGATAILTAGGVSTYTWNGGATSNPYSVSPAVTTTYTVTGATAAGCTNTAVAIVTVNPLPTVVAVASNSVICLGQSTTLTGSGAATYTWSAGVTNGLAFSPTTTNTYTVTGTSAAGCTNTAVTSVTVNPTPAILALASSSVICAGQTVVLTGSGASSYTWSSGVSNGVAFSPTATAVYTVSGTPGTGCANTATVSVTVDQIPTLVVTSSNSVICVGQSTSLTASGASTYTWSNGINNGVAFSPTTTTSYTVTGATAGGCTNTAVATIVVNPLPTLSVTASNTVICKGQSLTLNGAGANTYVWTGGVIDGVAFSPSVTATYTVTGTSAAGCKNTTVVTVSVTPIPNPAWTAPSLCLPSAAINLSHLVTGTPGGSWSGTGVSGTSFNPNAGTQTVTYSVSIGACTQTSTQTITINRRDSATISYASSVYCLQSGINPTPTIGGTTGGVFTISAPGFINSSTGQVAIQSSGAGSFVVTYNTSPLGHACPAAVSTTINIIKPPGAAFSYTNSVYCKGGSNQVPVFRGNNVAGTFSVKPAGLVFTNATNGIINLANSAPGVYTIYNTTAATGGCSAVVDSFNVTITQVKAAISASPNSGFADLDVAFTNGSSTGANISYLWNFGALGGSSSEFNPSYTFHQPGTYTVNLLVSNGACSDTANVVIFVDETTLYIPNAFTPDGDHLNESFGPVGYGIGNKDYGFYIFNRWGEKLYESHTPYEAWDGTYKGQTVQCDVYVWKLIYFTNGKDNQKAGTVTVIR
ncbi:MAG: gliding motility-associated C-terminal domain-containing protein [Bacteroidetes bacterium]|nr:gliding motility-associated C-terminal domain-containing protein [Bacteroidota bacterium]